MAVIKNSLNGKTIGGGRREEESKFALNKLQDDKNSIIKEVKTFDIERIKFQKQAKFIDGVEYYGVTTNANGIENDDGTRTLIVEAELENETGRKRRFNKFIDFEPEEGTTCHRFCENMNALSKEGRIVLQSLIGQEVVVKLYTNSKKKTYISTIFPTDSSEDAKEELFTYDNDFTYNDGEDGGCIYESD